jgi:hypothetical protein
LLNPERFISTRLDSRSFMNVVAKFPT